MNEFKSADDILDYAIQREQEAVDFCSDLAAGMEDENVRATFLGLAQDVHRAGGVADDVACSGVGGHGVRGDRQGVLVPYQVQ